MENSVDILEQEKEKVDRLLSMNYILPDNSEFLPTPGGFVSLKFEGKFYDRVNFHLMFPFSAPDKYISVREPDDKASEIGIIEELSAFGQETAGIISKQLELRYFMPKILKILSIKEEYGFAYWSVVTDKGPCKFTMSTGLRSTAKVGKNRLIVKDIDENRYEIEDMSRLSKKEIKKLDLYV